MTDDEKENDPGQDVDQQEALLKALSSVKDIATYNLSLYAGQAWHHLGLVPIHGGAVPQLDLDQAKLAIDLFEANLNVLAPHLDKGSGKDLRRTLMDLQMNYINKSEKRT
jgi:hypothetical protein